LKEGQGLATAQRFRRTADLTGPFLLLAGGPECRRPYICRIPAVRIARTMRLSAVPVPPQPLSSPRRPASRCEPHQRLQSGISVPARAKLEPAQCWSPSAAASPGAVLPGEEHRGARFLRKTPRARNSMSTAHAGCCGAAGRRIPCGERRLRAARRVQPCAAAAPRDSIGPRAGVATLC